MNQRAGRLSLDIKGMESTSTNVSRDIQPPDRNQIKIIPTNSPLHSVEMRINIKFSTTQKHTRYNQEPTANTQDTTVHIVEDEHRLTLGPDKEISTLKTTLRRNVVTSQENNPLIISNRRDNQVLVMEKTNSKEFPTFQYKSNFKQINFDCNRISFIPTLANLEKLEILKLNQNCIVSVPSNIRDLVSLKELHLCRNYIGIINEDIGLLTELRVLVLSHNKLHEIPNTIGKLAKLRSFELQGNYFISLPTTLCNLIFLERFGMEWFFYVSKERIIIIDERNIDILRSFKLICSKYKESGSLDFLTYFKETMAISDCKISSIRYDSRGRNLLHMASINNHTIIAQVSLPYFTNINLTDGEGSTALLLALQYKCEGIANLLLNHSASPCISNSKFGSPINIALANELFTIAEKILQKDKINANCKDVNGNNPLHLIIRSYDKNEEIAFKICNLLVYKHQSKLNEYNKCGFTPFLTAVKKGQILAVKYILKFNSENSSRHFNIKDYGGKEKMNALHYAALYSDIKMAKLLVNEGIDLLERDSNNKKPLQHCSELNIKKYLLIKERNFILERFKNKYGLSRCTLNASCKSLYGSLNKNLVSAFCDTANESCFMDNYDMQEGIKNTDNLEMYDHSTRYMECETERRKFSIKALPPNTRSNGSVMHRSIKNTSKSPFTEKANDADKTNVYSQTSKLHMMNSIRQALRISVQSPFINGRQQATPLGFMSNSCNNKIKVTITESYILKGTNKADYKNAVCSVSKPCSKYKAVYSLFSKLDEIALLQAFNKVNSTVIKLDIVYLLSLLNSVKISYNDVQTCDLVKSTVKNSEIMNCIHSVSDGVPKYIILFLLECSQIRSKQYGRPVLK